MESLSQPILIALFLAAGAVVWWAGIHLAAATDALDGAFGWGQALGGMVLLALVTNLPEIAIVASAVTEGRIEVAVGNILGGIAIQTVVLAVLDAFGNRGNVPLSTRASSPDLMLEGLLVIVVLSIALLGHFLPASLIVLRVTPAGAMIVAAWIAVLLILRRMRADSSSRRSPAMTKTGVKGIGRASLMFAITALATLGAGILLERSGDVLAQQWGMQGALFGATVLAAATSLPEFATGIASTRRREYALATSDILGGNAFLPVLFVLATLMSGKAVLPTAQGTDLYLTALGILLSVVFIGGMIVKPQRKRLGMGPDAWLLVGLYALGACGLFFITPGG